MKSRARAVEDPPDGPPIDTSTEWRTPPAPVTGGARAGASLRGAVLDLFSGTPGRLRGWGALVAAVCLTFGIVGGLTSYNTTAALQRAREDTDQVFRAQNIYADLMRADATAANSFLVAGDERESDRAAYDNAIESADRGLAAALTAQPADARPLTALSVAVTKYARMIDYARAENRGGMIVGGEYQRIASTDLRQNLPMLIDVREANQTRAQRELAWPGLQAQVLLGASVATVVLLLVCAGWLTLRFNRWINSGLAVATLLIVLGAAVAIPTLLALSNKLDDYRTGALADTIALSEARQSAYSARSLESLSLIARDADTSTAGSWTSAYLTAHNALTAAGENPATLEEYESQHRQIVALDRGGQWSAARDLAVDDTSATFARLDQQIARRLAQERQASEHALATGPTLTALAVGLPVLGIAAAIAALIGINQRLREYR